MKRSFSLRITALLLAAAMLFILCSCELGGSKPAVSDTDAADAAEEPAKPETYPVTLDGLIAELNAERSVSAGDLGYSMEDFLPDYTSSEFLADEFTEAEFRKLTTDPGLAQTITVAKALEDTDYMFRILRTSYGAYTFFGGDEVFGAAKQAIVDEINTKYGEAGEIAVSAYASLLRSKLDFVEDTHFSINGSGTPVNEQYYFRACKSYPFREDELGFYTCTDFTKDGERWYISEEDEQYLHLTIGLDGELVYGLFTLGKKNAARNLPDSITLTNAEGETVSIKTNWTNMTGSYEFSPTCYVRNDTDGIPVVTLTSYYLEEDSFISINRYLNDAKTLRDEDVIVVDLRYNTGGYDVLSSMWLYSLTSGTDIEWGIGYDSYISRLNEYILTNNEEEVDSLFDRLDFFNDYPEYWGDEESEDEELKQGDTYIIDPVSEFYEQDRTIFVLFNKNTYSAGELALFQFENMENVVFVGQNSNGCLLTGGVNIDAPVYLPNSGISITYGMILVTSDIMNGFDAYGFQPDIIVDETTAIRDVINCWKFYHPDEAAAVE